ncbi:hypothetical protein MD484_g2968, partial [Candolleomyces efflorescens]
MYHLPRFLNFRGRPTAELTIDVPPKPSDPEPFIPPDIEDMSPTEPVIPNDLVPVRPYRFSSKRNTWKHVPRIGPEEIRDLLEDDDSSRYPSSVRIITWNLDFQFDYQEERLLAALRYLENDVLGCKEGGPPYEPCVICLQEVHEKVMPVLLNDRWVKRSFCVTPVRKDKWPEFAVYGNVTLVSKSLRVVKSDILHYGHTDMWRTGLAAYIMLSEPEPSREKAVICVVNTHLESLPQGAIARPRQLELSARFLKQADVRGGVVVGDMNPISPEDAGLAMEVGLRDAWRRGDKDEAGFTWGYQGHNEKGFPPARFDKVLYLPRRGYRLDEPERFGMGAKVEGLEFDGMEVDQWISDHYGLSTVLRMVARRNSA